MPVVEYTLNRDIQPFSRLLDRHHIQGIQADFQKDISPDFEIGSNCMRIICKLMTAAAAIPSDLFVMNITAIKLWMHFAAHRAYIRFAGAQILIYPDHLLNRFPDCVFLIISQFSKFFQYFTLSHV